MDLSTVGESVQPRQRRSGIAEHGSLLVVVGVDVVSVCLCLRVCKSVVRRTPQQMTHEFPPSGSTYEDYSSLDLVGHLRLVQYRQT